MERDMRIEPETTYRIKGDSKYFRDKYGTSNPTIRVEGLDVDVMGKSWGMMDGHPAAILYAMRSAGETPLSGNVYYGKVGCLGEFVHETELEEVPDTVV